MAEKEDLETPFSLSIVFNKTNLEERILERKLPTPKVLSQPTPSLVLDFPNNSHYSVRLVVSVSQPPP
jgi:hypothetical protein